MITEEQAREIVQTELSNVNISQKMDLLSYYINLRKGVEIGISKPTGKPSLILMYRGIREGMSQQEMAKLNDFYLLNGMFIFAVNWLKKNMK